MGLASVLQELEKELVGRVSKARVHFAIYAGHVPRPRMECGRFAFSDADVAALIKHFQTQAQRKSAVPAA